MISDITVSKDDAGFPIVSWRETRGLHSPEALGKAHVECRIMKRKNDGTLLFVARGTVRHGRFEQGKPWERLKGFKRHSAPELYHSKWARVWHEYMSKMPSQKVLWHDGAQVIAAEFALDTAIHVNCAEASYVELEDLVITLSNAFASTLRGDLVRKLCTGDFYKWPLDDARVITYDPERSGWPDAIRQSVTIEVVAWAIVLAALGSVGVFCLWGLGIV